MAMEDFYLELGKNLEFSVGFMFYYCGERFNKIFCLGYVDGLDTLFIHNNKVSILDSDKESLKDRIRFKGGNPTISLSDDEKKIFEKRFNRTIEDFITPLIINAVSKIQPQKQYVESQLKDDVFYILDSGYSKFEHDEPLAKTLDMPYLITEEFMVNISIMGMDKLKVHATKEYEEVPYYIF